jgi:hypothetical protein
MKGSAILGSSEGLGVCRLIIPTTSVDFWEKAGDVACQAPDCACIVLFAGHEARRLCLQLYQARRLIDRVNVIFHFIDPMLSVGAFALNSTGERRRKDPSIPPRDQALRLSTRSLHQAHLILHDVKLTSTTSNGNS